MYRYIETSEWIEEVKKHANGARDRENLLVDIFLSFFFFAFSLCLFFLDWEFGRSARKLEEIFVEFVLAEYLPVQNV